MKPIIAILLLFFTACTEVKPPAAVTPTEIPKVERIALWWENTSAHHPERKVWSDLLTANISSNLSLYSEAKDIAEICPKYFSLSDVQKVKAIGEFYVALAYNESGFKVDSNSVDVGNKTDKSTWSVGLYQLSASDKSAKAFKATFDTLKDPLTNISVATEQMKSQLKTCGELILPNASKCRYWAIILEGNKYQKISDVKSRVLKYAPACK